MKKINFIILFILISINSFSQQYKTFTGKLVYSVQMVDTAMQKFYSPRLMTVYTNDTIVRIENFSDQLGPQTIIKHTLLNKSILLLQAKNNYYAIQTDLNKKALEPDSTKLKQSIYTYKKKCGKRKIANLKANRMKVEQLNNNTSYEVLYLKDYSPKYIDAFTDLPGLAVHYYIDTEDGRIEYTLLSMEKSVLNKDLFGVPSNYKRVSFSQFLEEILSKEK